MFGPLIVKPKKSRPGATGSWRVRSRPKFLQKDCIACNMCLLICPEHCISGKEKNSYRTDYNYCKGCGLCAAICPKKDIEMIDEPQSESKE